MRMNINLKEFKYMKRFISVVYTRKRRVSWEKEKKKGTQEKPIYDLDQNWFGVNCVQILPHPIIYFLVASLSPKYQKIAEKCANINCFHDQL